ncbi:GNAT family N-acetyltransferase [Timonella sp. A28]|uniref:GNAT family N-acetyltransferase n=1 Tax=Timonella sp. A28 TaxID=3442640 RepID=UPI003EC005E1
MVLFTENADVSVRPAIAQDAPHIARIQNESWTATLPHIFGPESPLAVDVESVQQQWLDAIVRPPSAEYGLFTALSGGDIVGFCAVAPQTIIALEVTAAHQKQGHGSRLLTAAVDTLQRNGATQVTVWIPETAAAKQAFYASAGLAQDGRVRQLNVDSDTTLVEERWHAELA